MSVFLTLKPPERSRISKVIVLTKEVARRFTKLNIIVCTALYTMRL